jgi:toxin FitB
VSYLLDTNVISELRRKQPDSRVVAWFEGRAAQSLFLSVLTLGEIRKGIAGLNDSRADAMRRHSLNDWLEQELPNFFLGRVLSVDGAVADRWGRLQARTSHPLPAIDSLLAATALQHRLTLVTRNVKDFADAGVELINPWAFEDARP